MCRCVTVRNCRLTVILITLSCICFLSLVCLFVYVHLRGMENTTKSSGCQTAVLSCQWGVCDTWTYHWIGIIACELSYRNYLYLYKVADKWFELVCWKYFVSWCLEKRWLYETSLFFMSRILFHSLKLMNNPPPLQTASPSNPDPAARVRLFFNIILPYSYHILSKYMLISTVDREIFVEKLRWASLIHRPNIVF